MNRIEYFKKTDCPKCEHIRCPLNLGICSPQNCEMHYSRRNSATYCHCYVEVTSVEKKTNRCKFYKAKGNV